MLDLTAKIIEATVDWMFDRLHDFTCWMNEE